MDSKTAIVTGAAGFLGVEHCRGLAEKGASIVAVDVDADRCGGVAAAIADSYGVRARGIAVDVTRKDEVQALISETRAEFGSVDILVNNAQLQLCSALGSFESLELDDWRRILDVNLTGAFLCCQAAGSAMCEQGRGSIINLGSTYGMLGPDFRIYAGTEMTTAAVYSASKAGIFGLTRYLATYWAPRNVRVNAVTPGGIRNQHTDPFLSAYSARVPMGRMGERSELRGIIQFLASDASSYVTGQNFPIDGGLSAW